MKQITIICTLFLPRTQTLCRLKRKENYLQFILIFSAAIYKAVAMTAGEIT
jgi:hypothetical protein